MGDFSFDHVWMKAAVLMLVHLFAPAMRPWLQNKQAVINAFGGGMAISYVFIHLLPEIGEGKEHLGFFTFIIVLVGYLLFYLINAKGENNHAVPSVKTKTTYNINIAQYWVYSFILIVGLPKDFSQSHMHIMLMTFAASLHIIHADYEIGEENPILFKKSGHYILATAPLAGIFARWFLMPDSDLIVHSLTSILAGALIYSMAKQDQNHVSNKVMVWFFAGILVYTGLLLLIMNT